jgi:hypothetical protein
MHCQFLLCNKKSKESENELGKKGDSHAKYSENLKVEAKGTRN